MPMTVKEVRELLADQPDEALVVLAGTDGLKGREVNTFGLGKFHVTERTIESRRIRDPHLQLALILYP